MPALLSEKKIAEALAHLQRDGLRLQLLGVAAHIANSPSKAMIFGDPDRRADDVPERGLAGRGGDADARRPAVDVVRDVRRFDVPGQRANAAALGLREQRMIGEPLIGQQGLQGAGAAPESQRVDRAAWPTSGATW